MKPLTKIALSLALVITALVLWWRAWEPPESAIPEAAGTSPIERARSDRSPAEPGPGAASEHAPAAEMAEAVDNVAPEPPLEDGTAQVEGIVLRPDGELLAEHMEGGSSGIHGVSVAAACGRGVRAYGGDGASGRSEGARWLRS